MSMKAVKEQFLKCDGKQTGRISEDAMTELVGSLCGESIPKEVICGMYRSFDGGTSPHGSINYNDFIEWLFQALEAGSSGCGNPKPSTAAKYRLFCSHQHTAGAVVWRKQWLRNAAESAKASTPPFNISGTSSKEHLPEKCQSLNIATFGVKLPTAIMRLFESEEMQLLSKELRIPIPKYSLDSFVQKKMPKVMDLIKAAKDPKEPSLDAKNIEACSKLEKFCNAFAALDKPDGTKITGPDEWQRFVETHVDAGWEDKLHFETVLVENFGFDREVSDRIRQMTIDVEDKGKIEQVTLEHHALRWLTKAFKGYGPVGCLTDVVNMIYAMLNKEDPGEASEKAAIEAVNAFHQHLMAKDFRSLWIPTHIVHDAESDDALSWLLLERLHRILGTQVEVCIQLPVRSAEDETKDPKVLADYEKIDKIADFFQNEHPVKPQVFRDKDSRNVKPVAAVWAPLLAKP